MTIRTILILGALGFLGLLSAAFAVTLMSPDSDAAYINLAGRQRMLSQKVSKEALTYLATGDAATAGQLQKTMDLFSTTHTALLSGGSAPTKLDGSSPVELAGAADDQLQGLLGEVGKQWDALSATIAGLKPKMERRRAAFATISEKNDVLLRKMDEAVRLMAAAQLSPDQINIAGRQRMLSQRVVKQALLFERSPSPETAQAAQATIKLFDTSLKSLQHGGSVPLKLDGSVPKLIDGVDGKPGLVAQLEMVEALWADHKDAFKAIFDPKAGVEGDRAKILSLNPEVLKTMNAAVGRAQVVAEARAGTIRQVNTIAVTVGLVLALISVFIAFGIGRSLRSLREAADAISTGDLQGSVPAGRFGEVRELSASLERMRTSLGQAMRMLAEDDDDDPLLAS